MMTQAAFDALLYQAFERNALLALLTRERADRLYALTLHMLKINESFNLTAIKDIPRIILLHYADSLKGIDTFAEGATVVDIGCGAGFPSLPLALFRPDLRILAVDSTAKRVGYVAETAKMLGLDNLDTLTARAEDLGRNPRYRERFDHATARAVAALPILCELCLPLVRIGGSFAAMKGKNAAEELRAAKHAIQKLGGGTPSLSDTPLWDEEGVEYAHATIVIPKKEETSALYPRLYTKIAKAPL